ncbi:hypothetical protein F0562_009152 [Nyssa sinensis]|uniref:Protein kinase domain-containing protein n=1 Tax=Nyssa sinensis TaxID=561372 RepID=A0A5J4ZXY7_9ASTE|nr:hypothetical protein F0562_009152 [Nyssa sinensis]
MGYIAPDFGSEGRVSTKGDVFSYGIMLMEIFTRKKPMDAMFSGEWSLRQWVSCSFPDRVMEVVDADLLIHEQGTTGTNISFSSIMELALLCTKDLPEERLTMTDVVARLTKIKQQLLLHATISR